MSNSKRRCTYCHKYKPTLEMVIVPVGAFCNDNHRYLYGIESTAKLLKKSKAITKKKHVKEKQDFYDNDLKTRKKIAQTYFNSFIRARDKGLGCCSCDKPDNGTHQRHASHYRSVGACSALRFNEFNVHTSCAQCNSMKSGNITEYRIRLVNKIGVKKVEWLECQNQIVRYTCEQLKEIELHFKDKLKAFMLP